MTTDELIRQIRFYAKAQLNDGIEKVMNAAADRLEELDERVAIMEEGKHEGAGSM